MSRSTLLRSASVVGALALVGALSLPTAAQAAPGDDVLVFSNSFVVDTGSGVGGGEYEWISAAIGAAGYVAIPFDGGDGQAATWSAALADVDYFVLPDQEMGDFYDPGTPPSWLGADAWGVLIDWIQAGGTFLVSGTCTGEQAGTGDILNAAVGVDYQGVLGNCYEPGSSTRWIGDSSLPATLDDVNGTYAMRLADFSPEQLAPLTVWYSSAGCGGELLTVGEFAAGSGRVVFEAWDYFNDTGNTAGQADWNDVLPALLEGNEASSTWGSGTTPAKTPISATTATGQKLFTIGSAGCEDSSSLYRVNPGTGDAAPIGSDALNGLVGQGATDPTTGVVYVPLAEGESDPTLYTIDTDSGDFTEIGEFTGDFDAAGSVYSIAIAADGSAYAFAYVYRAEDEFLGFFSLDLSDATLTLIAEIDDEIVEDPYAFAFNPVNDAFYVFDEEGHEFFAVNVTTGALTELGELAGASLDQESYVLALQVDSSGTFWVSYDVPLGDDDWWSMLSTFTLADISGGNVQAHEVGLLIDDPIYTHSLLLSAPIPQLAATGVSSAGVAGIALGGGTLLLLGLGLGLVAVRRRRTA